MLPSEALYPYTAKEARERGELELWRANFRTNCACAGAIELAIRKGFDGMHLSTDCAKSVIDQYLCLDNDEAGEDACDGMLDTLEDMGYDVERLRPEGRDWNDDLRAKRGKAKTPTA